MLKLIPYLLSQYVWILLLCLLYIIIIPFKIAITTKDFFFSDNDQIWNSSSKPYWLLHVSDLHISSVRPNSYNNIYNRLKTAIDNINPQYIIMSGDITDNSRNSKFREYVKMEENDWILYDQLISSLNLKNSEKLIEAAGNHDLFNIKKFSSPIHHANNRLYNSSNYHFHIQKFSPDPSELTIVSINPYEFPTPPNDMLQWASPTEEFRDELKSILKNATSRFVILNAHHPALLWYPTYATASDVTINEILTQSKNVRFFLSGHLHPKKPQFMHHGDTLEVVATPLFRNNEVGLVTFDNHRAAYHQIDLSKKPYGAITSPVPVKQSSGLDSFFDNEGFDSKSLQSERKLSNSSDPISELRVLVFTDKKNLNLVASGAVNGKLACTFIEKNAQLCSLPIPSMDNNVHSISVTGDWTGSVNFADSKTAIGFTEIPYSSDASVGWIFIFIIFYIFAFILTMPVDFLNVNDAFNRWVYYKGEQSHWLFAIFGGFLIVKANAQQSSLLLKYSLFAATLYILFLPISFFSIENEVSVLWIWGYISMGKNIYMFFGMKFATLFITFVLFPILLLLSSVETTKSIFKVFYFDVAVYIAFAAGWLYTISELVEWFGFLSALLSPLIVLIPIYLHIITILFVIQKSRIEIHNYRAENDFNLRAPLAEVDAGNDINLNF
ncbi:Transmembrane protein 62 [Tritrichomonas musculus]|uniref:Transmembrane protein 62 n=1 Tax=Tritrichomonas musculus TaxID=1915356 RepID=A0ABR2KGY3_9EUKA